jgi:hypothetical protein
MALATQTLPTGEGSARDPVILLAVTTMMVGLAVFGLFAAGKARFDGGSGYGAQIRVTLRFQTEHRDSCALESGRASACVPPPTKPESFSKNTCNSMILKALTPTSSMTSVTFLS